MNTVILCLLWSTSAYSFYFTEFYMKYVPVSNVYYLAWLMGASDLITNISFGFLNRHYPIKSIIILSTFLLSLSSVVLSLTLSFTKPNSDASNISSGLQVFFSSLVFGLRFFSALTFISVYYANNEYFPTLMKGAIFAVTNVVARLASVMSPLVAEWMANPTVTVALAAVVACIASIKLKKHV